MGCFPIINQTIVNLDLGIHGAKWLLKKAFVFRKLESTILRSNIFVSSSLYKLMLFDFLKRKN